MAANNDISAGRVRSKAAAGELVFVPVDGIQRFPRFQFEDQGGIRPGLDKVSPHIPDEWPAPSLLPAADPHDDLISVTRWLWRILPTSAAHAGPRNALRHGGPVAARFDPHPPPPGHHPGYGVFYAGSDAVTALAEAFGTNRTVDVRTGEPWLVKFELQSPGVERLELSRAAPAPGPPCRRAPRSDPAGCRP